MRARPGPILALDAQILAGVDWQGALRHTCEAAFQGGHLGFRAEIGCARLRVCRHECRHGRLRAGSTGARPRTFSGGQSTTPPERPECS